MKPLALMLAVFLLSGISAYNAALKTDKDHENATEEVFGEWRILRYVTMPGADPAKAAKFIAKRILLGKAYTFYIEISCTTPVYEIKKAGAAKYLAKKYNGKVTAQQLGIKTDSIYTVHLGCGGHAKYDNTVLPDFGGDMIYDGKKLYAYYNGTFYIAEQNND